MSKYLDINKIYKDENGDSFTYVVLDERQGIACENGAYQTSSPDDKVKVLNDSTFAFIKSSCIKGDNLLAKEDDNLIKEAFSCYAHAMSLIPEPTHSWHAAGWILSRMGECYFRAGDYEKAEELYMDLMWFPGAIGNPWIHLRQGQIRFELGDFEKAGDELMRAYWGGGKDIFSLEDPKYYEFLKSIAEGLE